MSAFKFGFADMVCVLIITVSKLDCFLVGCIIGCHVTN